MRLPPKIDRGAVLAALQAARALIIAEGWLRAVVDDRGRPRERLPGEGWTLRDALFSLPVTIHRYHASRVLEIIGGDYLGPWNAHPHRDAHQAIDLLDRGIRALGGQPPRTSYRAPRRGRRFGSWFVSAFKPRGETRAISSQGSGAPGVVGVVPPASGALFLSRTGVPGMDNETKKPPASFGSMLEIAATQPIDDLAAWVEQHARMTMELQRVFAARAKSEAPGFLGLDNASAELASDLESKLFMFSTQRRVAKKLAAPAPGSSALCPCGHSATERHSDAGCLDCAGCTRTQDEAREGKRAARKYGDRVGSEPRHG